jgi:hypothetical protein
MVGPRGRHERPACFSAKRLAFLPRHRRPLLLVDPVYTPVVRHLLGGPFSRRIITTRHCERVCERSWRGNFPGVSATAHRRAARSPFFRRARPAPPLASPASTPRHSALHQTDSSSSALLLWWSPGEANLSLDLFSGSRSPSALNSTIVTTALPWADLQSEFQTEQFACHFALP